MKQCEARWWDFRDKERDRVVVKGGLPKAEEWTDFGCSTLRRLGVGSERRRLYKREDEMGVPDMYQAGSPGSTKPPNPGGGLRMSQWRCWFVETAVWPA